MCFANGRRASNGSPVFPTSRWSVSIIHYANINRFPARGHYTTAASRHLPPRCKTDTDPDDRPTPSIFDVPMRRNPLAGHVSSCTRLCYRSEQPRLAGGERKIASARPSGVGIRPCASRLLRLYWRWSFIAREQQRGCRSEVWQSKRGVIQSRELIAV